MKLLLDECLHEKLRDHIPGHDVYTVGYLGWKSIKNGVLLRTAADAGFDALITVDQGIIDQHNPATLPLAVIVLRPERNLLDNLIALVPNLLAALEPFAPKTFKVIEWT